MSVEDLPRTIELVGSPKDAVLSYIDERHLPQNLILAETRDWRQVISALQTLAVRGAPAIGCAGAAAMALWICNEGYPAYAAERLDAAGFMAEYARVADEVAHARPTAVNLAWAVQRITEHLFGSAAAGEPAAAGDSAAAGEPVSFEASLAASRETLDSASRAGIQVPGDAVSSGQRAAAGEPVSFEASLAASRETLNGASHTDTQVPGDAVSSVRRNAAEAHETVSLAAPLWPDLPERAFAFVKELEAQDEAANRAMGAFGAALLPEGCRALTHCNAGSLATAFYGTALGVIYAAADQGKIVRVYSDETRPVGQGVRLTSWELACAGVPVTIICDNMAASLMAAGKIDAVIVGADRIAANGDVANKIGTYGVAVCARHHGIPFYVAAPVSTFDLSLASGADIPIEQRAASEITDCIPDGAEVYNPAFDVTPADLVTAIITERGAVAPGTPEWSRFITGLQ